MIKFKIISIEGVGSIIRRTTYRLDTPGLTIINGENGAGKTTIFNALSWCLYKKLLKAGSSLEPWEHIKPEGYGGMYVKVIFLKGEDKYEIYRVQDYKSKLNGKRFSNGIMIFKNGEEQPLKYKKDNQRQIIEILGYSFDLFKSTILFGQELKRMMGEDGPTKKKILEETFDATFINLARETINERIIPIIKEYQKLKEEINAQCTIKSNLLELIKSGRKQKANFKTAKEKQIAEYQKEIDELRSKIIQVEPREEPDPYIKDREFKFNFELMTFTDKLDKLKIKADNIKEEFTNLPKNCSKCGEPISGANREKMVNNLKKEYTRTKHDIFNLEVEVAAKNKEYNKILDELDRYKKERELWADYNVKAGKNETFIKKISNLEDKINNQNNLKLKVNLKSLKEKLQVCKEKLEAKKEKAKVQKEQIDLNNWLLNDPLSNSGLKAFIFDAMLKKINNQLVKYTQQIGFGVRIFIDLKSASKNVEIAITNKDSEVLYNDLSGGQKQLVDIALLFANNDVVYEDKPINILILDEVFERLKSKNIEIVSDIITAKSSTRSIHLITHLSTFAPIAAKNVYITLNDKGHSILK